jgi:hypothetical protein
MNEPQPKMSVLAVDVARGVYADDAEMFQRDLDSVIRGATGRISNVSAWAQNQLRIVAEMATDRDVAWVATEANRIRAGLEKP